MLKKFNPAGWPENPAYSQAALATAPQKTLYVAAQVGVRPDGSVPDGVADQTVAALANLTAVLASADMTPEDLAKITIFLTDESDIPAFMQAAGGALPSPPAAATLLIVKALASPALKVEIEAIAVQ